MLQMPIMQVLKLTNMKKIFLFCFASSFIGNGPGKKCDQQLSGSLQNLKSRRNLRKRWLPMPKNIIRAIGNGAFMRLNRAPMQEATM